MSGLDNLFDSPPGPSRPPPPRAQSLTPSPSPPRRPRNAQPLFLSPAQSERPTSSLNGNRQKRQTTAEINAASGLDKEIDLDLLDEPEIDPFDLPSRPGQEGGGVYDPLAIGGGADGDEEAGRKKRKPIPKIDAERLMSEHGLPALMKEAKRFKIRGKGHEAQDLKALLGVYQLWAHRMFPKGDFIGTVGRVENVLRTRRMENAMKGYREAFYPRPPTPEPADGLDPDEMNPDVDFDMNVDENVGVDENHESRGHGDPSPPRRSSEPLFDPVNLDDEVDMDEMAAMEEMEREQAQAGTIASETRHGNGHTTPGNGPPPMDDEEEWEGLYD